MNAAPEAAFDQAGVAERMRDIGEANRVVSEGFSREYMRSASITIASRRRPGRRWANTGCSASPFPRNWAATAVARRHWSR